MSDGHWRPELSVCTSSSSSPELVVPANTLWYKTYRINVTATVTVNSNTASLERSSPATTYLAVQPCPLVASLDCDETNYDRPVTINLNMTASRDPDVIATNTSGIRLEVYCYPASAAERYERLNADQMHNVANSIANNRYMIVITFTQQLQRKLDKANIPLALGLSWLESAYSRQHTFSGRF